MCNKVSKNIGIILTARGYLTKVLFYHYIIDLYTPTRLSVFI